MNHLLRNIALAAGLSLTLSACFGSDNGGSQVVAVVPPPPTFTQSFGSAFAIDFNASNMSEPVDPTAADVPPLSLSTEPIDN